MFYNINTNYIVCGERERQIDNARRISELVDIFVVLKMGNQISGDALNVIETIGHCG